MLVFFLEQRRNQKYNILKEGECSNIRKQRLVCICSSTCTRNAIELGEMVYCIMYLQYFSCPRICFSSHPNIHAERCLEINKFLLSEEVLYTDKALWVSPNNSRLCWATFDDSSVEEVLLYNFKNKNGGAHLSTVRYPKVMTFN